jgi:hypothetical protein
LRALGSEKAAFGLLFLWHAEHESITSSDANPHIEHARMPYLLRVRLNSTRVSLKAQLPFRIASKALSF